MKRLVVHVDRLVLSGVSGEDASRIVEYLRQNLLRALTLDGSTRTTAAMRRIERLDAGTVHVSASTAARQIGATVAGAISRQVKT